MLNSKELLKELNIVPNKALGQNFLIDPNALAHIAALAQHGSTPVLEIGAGLGALTEILAENVPKLLAVEIDKRLADVLTARFKTNQNVTIMCRDFLKCSDADISGVLGTASIAVAANLPYYITSPICLRLVESSLSIKRMVLMMQDEAAERFTSGPSMKNYGPLSVLSQYLFYISEVFKLPPSSYYPSPEINSTVLCFERNSHDMPNLMPKVVKASFRMRRKTLLNNMLGIMSKNAANSAIENAGLLPSVRAEALTVSDFANLALAVEKVLLSDT